MPFSTKHYENISFFLPRRRRHRRRRRRLRIYLRDDLKSIEIGFARVPNSTWYAKHNDIIPTEPQ